MGHYENRHRCRQLSTLLPLSHLILAVSIGVLGFLERLERPYSILSGTVVDALGLLKLKASQRLYLHLVVLLL